MYESHACFELKIECPELHEHDPMTEWKYAIAIQTKAFFFFLTL